MSLQATMVLKAIRDRSRVHTEGFLQLVFVYPLSLHPGGLNPRKWNTGEADDTAAGHQEQSNSMVNSDINTPPGSD